MLAGTCPNIRCNGAIQCMLTIMANPVNTAQGTKSANIWLQVPTCVCVYMCVRVCVCEVPTRPCTAGCRACAAPNKHAVSKKRTNAIYLTSTHPAIYTPCHPHILHLHILPPTHPTIHTSYRPHILPHILHPHSLYPRILHPHILPSTHPAIHTSCHPNILPSTHPVVQIPCHPHILSSKYPAKALQLYSKCSIRRANRKNVPQTDMWCHKRISMLQMRR